MALCVQGLLLGSAGLTKTHSGQRTSSYCFIDPPPLSSSPSRFVLTPTGHNGGEQNRPRAIGGNWKAALSESRPLAVSVSPVRKQSIAWLETPVASPSQPPPSAFDTPRWLIKSDPYLRPSPEKLQEILPGRPQLLSVYDLLDRLEKEGAVDALAQLGQFDGQEDDHTVEPASVYESPSKHELSRSLPVSPLNRSINSSPLKASTSKRQRRAQDDLYKAERHGGSGRKLPSEATTDFSDWMLDNIAFAYPSEAMKRTWSIKHELSMTQINNWFLNARRRGKFYELIQAHKERAQTDR